MILRKRTETKMPSSQLRDSIPSGVTMSVVKVGEESQIYLNEVNELVGWSGNAIEVAAYMAKLGLRECKNPGQRLRT